MALTYSFIGTITLGSATQFITFSNIPQTFTDLVIHLCGRGNRPGFTVQDVLGTLSGFSDSMFGQFLSMDNSSPNSGYLNDRFWFLTSGASTPNNYTSSNYLYLHNYSNAITINGNTQKMLQIEESRPSNNVNNQTIVTRNLIFTRNDAVTSITFGTQTDAFVTNTVASLFGIRRA